MAKVTGTLRLEKSDENRTKTYDKVRASYGSSDSGGIRRKRRVSLCESIYARQAADEIDLGHADCEVGMKSSAEGDR